MTGAGKRDVAETNQVEKETTQGEKAERTGHQVGKKKKKHTHTQTRLKGPR